MSKAIEKRTIEQVISELFDGEMKKNTLDFMTYLHENKIKPVRSATNSSLTKSSWKISRKEKVVCYFHTDTEAGTLRVSPKIGEYAHDALSDELKEIVWANFRGRACGKGCNDGHCGQYNIKTIFGKEYADACGNNIVFTNPGISEIECIKELIKMRLDCIQNGNLHPASPKNLR